MDLSAGRQHSTSSRPKRRPDATEATLAPRLVSIRQAAEALGVSPNHFRAHILPALHPVAIGARRLLRVSEIDRLLDDYDGRWLDAAS